MEEIHSLGWLRIEHHCPKFIAMMFSSLAKFDKMSKNHILISYFLVYFTKTDNIQGRFYTKCTIHHVHCIETVHILLYFTNLHKQIVG